MGAFENKEFSKIPRNYKIIENRRKCVEKGDSQFVLAFLHC
jgi:hypothetical protein